MSTNKIGLGLLLPVERGPTGYFRQGFTTIEQIESNLINLLSTRKGERIFNPEFGCDIHELVFEQITDNFKTEVDATIQDAVNLWIPQLDVVLKDVRLDTDRNKVFIVIGYRLQSRVDNGGTITLVL